MDELMRIVVFSGRLQIVTAVLIAVNVQQEHVIAAKFDVEYNLPGVSLFSQTGNQPTSLYITI
jgi:hypothetical protein